MKELPLLMIPLLIAAAAGSARGDVARSLTKLDALFDGYYAWFGSMYDRHSGGAYYSPAARANPHRYPPHIESTSKYTRVLEWSGLLDDTPPAVRDAIVNRYLKPRQVGDPNHAWYGFFLDRNYRNLSPAGNGRHVTQWAAGRALGFAALMLELFDAEPDHPLPSADRNPAALAHLQSAEAFRQWLAKRNWTRTWSAGGKLLSQSSNIRQLDDATRKEILAAVWEYLENVQQDAATGYWGRLDRGANRRPYILLNGAHKIVAFYAKFDRPVPHAETLMDTALAEIDRRKAGNLLYVYNASQLVYNLKSHAGASISDAETARFISKATQYLARFRQPDGGFSTTLGGQGGNNFQPATPHAVSNTDVGGLALKTRNRLHDLARGEHHPPAAADDPRIFGMSGVTSEVLVRRKSPKLRAGCCALTVPPADSPRSLYFVAVSVRRVEGDKPGRLAVQYAVGDDPEASAFVEAGSTTFGREWATRDVPLLTHDALQNVKRPVTFRICVSRDAVVELAHVEVYGE